MAYNRSKFPEEYDVFEEKFDLPPRKEPLAQEWVQLFRKGEDRDRDEQNRYTELTKELSRYLINPEDINYFQDAMTNVQKFFKENTQDYVDNLQRETEEFTNQKQSEMSEYIDDKKDELERKQEETKDYADNKKHEVERYVDDKKVELEDRQDKTIDYISQFKYMGIYNNSRRYRQFNTVKFRGNMYLALKDTKGNDPTDIRYWVQIADNGDKVNWRGTWTPIINYKHLDMVRYDNSVYVCELANYDKNPALNEEYWRIVIDNRDSVPSEHYINFYDVNLQVHHNMSRIPQAQVVGYNGYGKGGFGMFGIHNRYNIPSIVEEIDEGQIKIFITEKIHGIPTVTKVKENEYVAQYPNEQFEMRIYLY